MPDDTGSIHLPGSAIVLDDSDINLCVRWKETRSSILIAVTSDFFRPAMEFSEDAAVTIDYGDGSVPQVHNIDSAEFAFDRYEFQDSSGEHKVEISVSPWESLSVLNLGFRGGDGGNGEYERENSEIPYIQFFPPYDEKPSHVPGEQDDIVLNGVGVVTEIRNLFLCCEFQPVETLDLSDYVNLLTLEAYFSSIKMTNSQECLSLRRCCLESTGAQYSWKIEGGARIESEILDLRDSPDLRDIRGINGDHVAVHLHPGAVSKLWHLCKMGNFRLTGIIIGNEAPSETVLSRFTKLRECWISYSPLFRTVHITNANADLYSLWLSGCGVETLDLENQTQVTHVEVDNNPLNEVNLAGCSNLVYLLMNNCNLSQVMIDGIITDLYGCFPENSDAGNQISLDGSNVPPSDSGMAFVTILRSRGWNIVINEPSE